MYPRVSTAQACLAWLAALLAAATAPAGAQTPEPATAYPSRNIMLVVPYAAAGPPDIVARILAVPMAAELGKPVVVENRPGASSAIAASQVARAAPDGYTIMAADISQAVAPFIMKSPGFDPIKDFKPIGITARSAQTIPVRSALPVKTIGDLVKLAKEKPGDIKVAHSGIGSPPYLGALAFVQATGIQLSFVHYRGIAQGVTDIVGGHVDMAFTAAGLTANLAKDGKLRVVAVTGNRRLPLLPDVPTLEEGGIRLPAMGDGNWYGLVAPAGTPDAIVARLNAAVRKATSDKEALASLTKIDFVVTSGSPEEFGKVIRTEYEFWRGALSSAGVKPEQ